MTQAVTNSAPASPPPSNVIRIHGVRKELCPPRTKVAAASPPADQARMKERWDFLARIGITDLLAHWMLDNLTENQITTMMQTFADYQPRRGQGALATSTAKPAARSVAGPIAGPIKAPISAAKALKTKQIAEACLRAVDTMKAIQGLSGRELEKCKARGVDPKKYAANKAAMTGGK